MGSLPGLALLVLAQELEELAGGTDGPLAGLSKRRCNWGC